MKKVVEYARTPLTGVTHLISVGEEPDVSTGDVVLKSAVFGAGVFVAVVGVKVKHAAWLAVAGFGAALIYHGMKRPTRPAY